MHGKIAIAAAMLAMTTACGQNVTPPEESPQDVDGVSRAPAQERMRAAEVDPTRVDAAPGSEALLARSGADPGYLVDSAGMAMYYVDGSGAPCDAACEAVWPPVLSEQPNPVAAPGVQQPAVGSETVQQGGNHVTYHGNRLYRYVGDRGAGTTTGDGVQDLWGHWRLMGIDGEPGVVAQREDAGR